MHFPFLSFLVLAVLFEIYWMGDGMNDWLREDVPYLYGVFFFFVLQL